MRSNSQVFSSKVFSTELEFKSIFIDSLSDCSIDSNTVKVFQDLVKDYYIHSFYLIERNDVITGLKIILNDNSILEFK